MKRKNEGQTSMLVEKPVALTDEEVAVKDREIRGLIRANKGLRSKMRADTRDSKAAIAENEQRIDVLMEQIDQGIELRKQGDLFAKEGAQKALHDVAEKVDPALAGGNGTSAAPKPSDPHAFEPSKKSKLECETCGSGPGDPVHKRSRGKGKTVHATEGQA